MSFFSLVKMTSINLRRLGAGSFDLENLLITLKGIQNGDAYSDQMNDH